MQTVKLTSRREVAPAVYELLFTRPEGWTFDAGQFARIGLATDGDEPVFRAYSIAGSPKAEGLRFLVKSVEGGALSPRLCALNPGDEVLLDGEAQGNLLPARIPGGDTVWMLATGSGLAPFIAMTGDEGTLGAWKKHILVIGARTREEVDRLAAYAESEARIPLTILMAASREAGELTGRIPALARIRPSAPVRQPRLHPRDPRSHEGPRHRIAASGQAGPASRGIPLVSNHSPRQTHDYA